MTFGKKILKIVLVLVCVILFLMAGGISIYVFQLGDNIIIKIFLFATFLSVLSRYILFLLYKNVRKDWILTKSFYPSISIVIACYNEAGVIVKTIKDIMSQKYPVKQIEFIIINDGSTDGTGEILDNVKTQYQLESLNLKVIHKKNEGKKKALYDGIMESKNEILVLIDSDTSLEEYSLQNIVKPLSCKDISGVVGNIIPRGNGWIEKMQRSLYFASFEIAKAGESVLGNVECLSGAFSAYRKSDILEELLSWRNELILGKENIFGEDRALTNVLLKKKLKTVFEISAVAYVETPNKFSTFMKQQLRWKKGFAISVKQLFWAWRKPLSAITIVYPNFIVVGLTPFVVLYVILTSLIDNSFPIFWLASAQIYATILLVINLYKKLDQKYKYQEKVNIFYFYIWSLFFIVFMSTLLIPALLTIQNRKWGTR